MSHRRYKCGTNPQYDKEFDWRKEKSGILNRGQSGVNPVTFDLFGESGIRQLLAEWAGNSGDGEYDNGSRIVNSKIRDAKERLASIDTRFENQKAMAVRSGKYPPETMPQEWVSEKLVLQARLDIVAEEIDWLRKELPKFQAQKQKQNDHLILAYGPMGSAAGADPPRSIDGQKVVWSEELGHFVIDCEKSPYHGMKLPDYYVHIAKPWRTEKQRLHREAHVISQNLDLPEGERRRAAEKAWRILRAADIPPWPERPEGL